jgi:hypothetical protein
VKFRLTYENFIRINFLFGIAVIITMMPFSRYVLSIGEFIATGAWAMERINRQKFLGFFRRPFGFRNVLLTVPFLLYLFGESIWKGLREVPRSKPAMVLMSIYLMHAAGLVFTSDFAYALKDLRIKLPIFILPLLLATSESIGKKGFYRFLLLFLGTLVVVTLMNTWRFMHGEFIDIRDVSKYTSHILVGLMLVLGVLTCGYIFIMRNRFPLWSKILLLLLAAWFFAYLVMTQSMTGIAVFFMTLVILTLLVAFRSRRRWLRPVLTLLILVSLGGSFFYLRSLVKDYYHVNPIDLKHLDFLSPRGNVYYHDPRAKILENGNYVWIYIQKKEMTEAWSQRSGINIDSLDLKGQPLIFTLVRFLASKGLRKDFDGVNALTNEEVQAIEKGTANVVYMEKFSIRGRIYELLMGWDTYKATGDPTGFTMMQRIEFWKAAAGIIRDNWLTGIGTGDLNEAFRVQYEKMHTKLAPEQRFRAHNQFLTILLTFGIFGLAWFLFALLYPPVKLKKLGDFYVLTLLIILLCSMITEDTLESQARVTFFWFWYCFFLFARKEEDPLVPSRSVT